MTFIHLLIQQLKFFFSSVSHTIVGSGYTPVNKAHLCPHGTFALAMYKTSLDGLSVVMKLQNFKGCRRPGLNTSIGGSQALASLLAGTLEATC